MYTAEEVKSDLWIGYGLEAPGINDAHITIAYYDEVGYQEAEHIKGIVANHHAVYPHPFVVVVTDVAIFGEGENQVPVVKVDVPDAIMEGMNFLRQRLYTYGRPMFSTKYGLDPHVTLTYEIDADLPISVSWGASLVGEVWPATFLHTEFNKVRTSFRIGKSVG